MANRATSAKVARTAELRLLVDELGDWAVGPGPLFRQLALAIARGIERGALAHGTRLPAERSLARSMSVSRGTAVAAYDQLVAQGLVERRRGSGTFAVDPGSLGLPPGREGSALVARLVEHSTAVSEAGEAGAVIDLSISVLHDAEGLPRASVSTRDLLHVEPDTGYSPWGLAGLRAAVADLVTSWGLPTTAAEIVITTGAQQAISTAAACWVRPGDIVVIEDPTYPGALSAFTAAGARLVGLPVDRNGVRVDALRDALAEHPALVYVQPTLHSPSGAVLAESRRAEIAALVSRARVPLVEDHALAGLCWTRAPAPIAAHATDQPIALVGSISKLFWGGLRIGFVRAPAPVALRFARVKAIQDLGTSAVGQVLAERLLRADGVERFVERRNRDLRKRYAILDARLRAELPSWRWTEPAGGLSVWVQLPAPVAEPFAQIALRAGVAVATAEALSPSTRHADRLRLSFSSPGAVLVEGIGRLATAWRDYTASY